MSLDKQIHLRPEQVGDRAQISELVRRAFDNRAEEPNLVDLIRERGNARLATVAEDAGVLVGYVLASPLNLVPRSPLNCLAIAPVAVIPERQGEGIGSQLIHHAIDLARDDGIDALFLLGHPSYYPRFGFAPTHIGNEYGATDAFMALELRKGCLDGISATAKYVKEFSDVGA